MQPHSLSFETWCKNHDNDHEAKWCRELYPWDVLKRIDFDQRLLGFPQTITVGRERFVATLRERFVGTNGRVNWLFHLLSPPAGEKTRWSHRSWDDVLHLVVTVDGQFITVFSKSTDPSKLILKQFFAGTLVCDEHIRSIPVSAMLFRSLVSYAAEDIFGPLDREFTAAASHDVNPPWIPFLSRGRELWVACAFTEEKAHRIGLRNTGAAERLVVVYSQPTFSKHHRCNAPNVLILSLQQFLSMSSSGTLLRYMPQARLLLTHLREWPSPTSGRDSSTDIFVQIRDGVPSTRTIETSELREARSGLAIAIATAADVAYVCACGNLINAAMNWRLGLYAKSIRLSKEVYSFKSILGRALEQVVSMKIPGVDVYVAPDGVVYVRVHGMQFSYHAIPRLPALDEFAESDRNLAQDWSGLRLQPIAPLVLDWARALLREELNSGRST